jgi:hypothetical protein
MRCPHRWRFLTSRSLRQNPPPSPKSCLTAEVSPSGGEYWRLIYRIASKERRAALGVYPEVSLKLTRDRAIDVNRQLSNGAKQTCAERWRLHNGLVSFSPAPVT